MISLTKSFLPGSHTTEIQSRISSPSGIRYVTGLPILMYSVLAILSFGLLLFTSCKKDEYLSPVRTSGGNENVLKASGLTYYIDPLGNDVTGNGSAGLPWHSLYKACSAVTVAGSIIHVNAGTYIETQESALAIGVSIEGAGESSVINFRKSIARIGGTSHGSLNLMSVAQGTNGNQSVSYLKIIGTGTPHGTIAIFVARRSNVKIHHLVIDDFDFNGITFIGSSSQYSTPAVYSTGNEIYNCTISKCGTADATYTLWSNGGLLCWAGQSGMLVHDNTLTNVDRTQGLNDNIVSVGYGNKGCRFYNNVSTKPDNNGTAWNFHIESWNVEGGIEIFNNTFNGGDCAVDIAGTYSHKGTYAFSYDIYNNTFRPVGTSISQTYHGIKTIDIEGKDPSYVIVRDNHFFKRPTPINLVGVSNAVSINNGCKIYRNIFESCGYNNSTIWDNIIVVSQSYSGSSISNFELYNNVIVADITRMAGIKFNVDAGCTFSNFNIKNNIILNCSNGTFCNIVNKGAINGLHIDNNCLSNNAGSNNPVISGNAVSNYSFTNSVKLDPKFMSSTDFRLQLTSPAIDAGTNVGLAYIGVKPDLGAIESSVGAVTNQIPIIQNQTFALNSNSANNTFVGKVVASDPDAGQTLTYSIISGNTSTAFAINAATGDLTVANSAALNFSTNPVFTLSVKVQDNGAVSLSNQATITINLKNAAAGVAAGYITYQKWDNLGTSGAISALTGSANYPNNPTTTVQYTSMEATTSQGEGFGARFAGYIYAPVSGSYTFWIASDDNGELWLSTNDQSSGKVRIAYQTYYTNSREWNKYATQKSVSISLVQGQKYYIEALMKEATGGDNLAVGWLKPGQTGTVPSEIIPGSVLSPL